MNLRLLTISVLVSSWNIIIAQDIVDYFADCQLGEVGFDACVREGLNAIRPFFKTGLPQYNIKPFDPFFAEEVSVSRGGRMLGMNLKLTNVTESGWTSSKVTRFVSDLSNYRVQYTQSFPEKSLFGDYEFSAHAFGNRMVNNGTFTLTLYDLVQTTTITMLPNSKLQAKIDVQTISNLDLHISNLVQGRRIIESVLDRLINTMWQPGFAVTRSVINELVSTAFTKIFGEAFQDFPFEKLFKRTET